MISQKKFMWLLSIVLLLLIVACSEEKKENDKTPGKLSQPVSKKIEKKIDVKQQDLSTEVAKEQAKEVGETKIAVTDVNQNVIPASDVAKEEAIKQNDEKKEEEIKAESKEKSYDPTGKINPFMPFMSEESEKKTISDERQKEKREPLTPLEKIDIAQLKLTAITRTPTGNIALVEEASGKGYIITEGTYIGLNSGKVISVLSDKVIIEEEIENIFGKVSIQERELKLQKPTGD